MIHTQTFISAAVIQQKIDDITHILLQDLDKIHTSGLYGGKAGIALYFAYLSHYQQRNDLDNTISQLITASFQDINEQVSSPTFSFGISGILWSIHHLKARHFIDTDDYFEEIIPFLGEQMLSCSRHFNFDFLHGALGIAFYLMHFKNPETDFYLSAFINVLQQAGIRGEHSIKWESSMNAENKKSYNLSLSHGMASIAVFLSYYMQQGRPAAEQTGKILKQTLHYLLSQKNEDPEKTNSLYPNSGELQNTEQNSRLSWCYGDLGIAVAFWQGGKALNERCWNNEARHILQHAAKRRELPMNNVVDAGFCHGTAGIAHIFNRFYLEIRKPFLKKAANYWITETLQMATWKDGLAGYKAWQGKTGWTTEYGLLEGIAGIGLALMSHLDEKTPSWDTAFLLS